MKVYFCSEFGDISIEEVDEVVRLKTTDLSMTEKKLLKEIIKKFKLYDLSEKESLEDMEVPLENVKLEDLHKFMKDVLKKNKPTITAIKYKDGKIEIVEDLKGKNGEVAVTTDKPVRGCPMPEMIQSEVRASVVLNHFLDNTQIKDFETYRQIVAIGNSSHKPYLITSRYSPRVVDMGQLYDIGDKKIICASCNEIPPSEEILALKLMIEHKEHEFLSSTNTAFVQWA